MRIFVNTKKWFCLYVKSKYIIKENTLNDNNNNKKRSAKDNVYTIRQILKLKINF